MTDPSRIDVFRAGLHDHHWTLIEDSAIDPEVAAERGYRTVTTKAVLGELGFGRDQRRVPALLIPVRGVTSEIVTYQCRPDDPRIDPDGRVNKYETPSGSKMALDVPLRVRPLLADPKVPLFITEGARKADAAASIGLCCLALLGVWNWRGTNGMGGKTALADWESIALNDRQVHIVFDSDVMTKRGVYSALLRLKAFLEMRGATVQVIYLPAGPGGAKVGLDDFLAQGKAVEELLALSTAELKPPPAEPEGEPGEGLYEVREGCMWWLKQSREGVIPVPLANFVARITRQVVTDDGVETQIHFEVEIRQGGEVAVARVPARSFGAMGWASEVLGAKGIVAAGMQVRDHLRAAIQWMSRDVVHQRVYAHTGWTRLPEAGWVYLHAGGFIGPLGPIGPLPEVEISLSGEVTKATLPEPPQGEELAGCIRESLALLELGPAEIAFPLYSGTFRAALGDTDFSLYLLGVTDTFKTERAALNQSFFGTGFDARNLPASWTSTANALETIAFQAKDMLLVVDDFVPSGTRTDIQRQHRDAERLMRSQGNRSGRDRLTADARLKKGKAPRGMMLSTGEDLPLHHSARARSLVLEVHRGDVSKEHLTHCQALRERAVYAKTMAGFLQWVAPQYEVLREKMKAWALDLREQAQVGELHRRTASIISELQAGFEAFLCFAVESGAKTQEEGEDLQRRCWAALLAAAEAQGQHQQASEPAKLFLRLLRSAIASGAAHLAATDGSAPDRPEAFGWRLSNRSSESGAETYQCLGVRVGWVDGDDVYLDIDAGLKAAQSMASEAERIPFGSQALSKRLKEHGYLKSTEEGRRHLTVRRTIERRRTSVLHISRGSLTEVAQVAQVAHEPLDEAPEALPEVDPWAWPAPSQPDVEPAGPLGPLGPPRSGDPPCGGAHTAAGGEESDATGGPDTDADGDGEGAVYL